jgi:hypothetical protein
MICSPYTSCSVDLANMLLFASRYLYRSKRIRSRVRIRRSLVAASLSSSKIGLLRLDAMLK